MEFLQNIAKKACAWFQGLPTVERLAVAALATVIGVALVSIVF